MAHNTLLDLIFVRTVNIPNFSLLPCLEVTWCMMHDVWCMMHDVTHLMILYLLDQSTYLLLCMMHDAWCIFEVVFILRLPSQSTWCVDQICLLRHQNPTWNTWETSPEAKWNKQAGRQADRQADRQTERQTDKQKDRQTKSRQVRIAGQLKSPLFKCQLL